jgi:hypothetical protein
VAATTPAQPITPITLEDTMIRRQGHRIARCCRAPFWVACILALLPARSGFAAAQEQSFATPEAAVQALVAALKANDTKALLAVLGSGARLLISSGDPVADRAAREHFLQSYDEVNSLAKSGDDKVVLQTGKDDWPFPIPIVKSDGSWRFDTAAGKEEILDRRIGKNELAAIQACLAYVDAQREYYQRDPDRNSLLAYAQKFTSTPGKRDGLYWPTKPDEDPSPLGPLFALAKSGGYAMKGGGKPEPYHGYYYRILKAQGPAAAGGAYDYVAHGRMFGGFALVAYPAAYGNSGIVTFIVNHDGVVFEKDLGPKTTAVATAMKTFDPDTTWKRVEVSSSAGPEAGRGEQ